MTNFLKTLIILVALGLQVDCHGQELNTFTGTIDYKFHLSGTHTIAADKRKELETEIGFYSKRKELLTDYFVKLGEGDKDEAERLLKKDKKLKDTDDFTLAYMFTLMKMKDLNILYKPCIQVNDDKAEGIIISCTLEQFEKIKSDKKEYILECRYVGELIVDKTKAYELVSAR